MSQSATTSMPSLTSQSCGDSLPAILLAGKDGTNYRLPEHPQVSDRLENEASVKADC